MSKHERLSNRHRSHHLVFCSPRVFVCNGQKFADLAYDVVFTHGSLITVFVVTVNCHLPLNEPLSRAECRNFMVANSKKGPSMFALTWRAIFNSIRCVSG